MAKPAFQINKIVQVLNKQKAIGVVTVLVLASIGVHFLFPSHAATNPDPYATVQADSGMLTGSATNILDPTASDGKDSVQFGSPANNTSGFVSVCGIQFCENGSPIVLNSATTYGTLKGAAEEASEVALAKQAGLNMLGIVQFEQVSHNLASMTSEATWTQVDQMVADARADGIHINLILSSYAQSLQAQGTNPYTYDWGPFLNFIANRVNTVDGIQYKNDPTIAMVELWGESCVPGEVDSGCQAATDGTASQITNFFHQAESDWEADAPNIMISTGGFSHLSTGTMPWQQILSDSTNPFCELEVNSPNDESNSIPGFTSYCKSIGKPWFLAAWSSCFQDGTNYPFVTNTDTDMAAHANAMYGLTLGNSPSNEVAAGNEFWNLRDNGPTQTPGHCDIWPAYPLTWSAIQAHNAATQ